MFEKLKNIGPGAMVAAAFIGPGTVTTATIAGGNFGYVLLWAIVFSIIATLVLQEMAARLGVVGKMGLGEAIRIKITHPILKIIASVLVVGAILVGNAAYEAGNITGAVLGFDTTTNSTFNPLVLLIGAAAFLLLYSGKYKWIERFLVVLVSVMGLVFFVSAILLKPDWLAVLQALFTPSLPEGSLMMVIGLIGTTVVPYNLFLHASSVQERWNSPEALSNARWDTFLSVTFGGIITMSILITAAIAFEGQDIVIKNAGDLSFQLQPILGEWSKTFIAIGFLAAGLSSSITAPLAAAFATSEILNWKKDLKGKQFRMIWIFVLGIGILFSCLGFKPTLVILFAQVANGLLLPIIASFLLWIMNDKNIMANYANSIWINTLGAVVILITFLLGMKGILAAFNVI